MITVRTYRNTPVVYRGETYRVTNLEVGDRIRVEAEPRDAQADEITARRIDVVQSVQDSRHDVAGRTRDDDRRTRVARGAGTRPRVRRRRPRRDPRRHGSGRRRDRRRDPRARPARRRHGRDHRQLQPRRRHVQRVDGALHGGGSRRSRTIDGGTFDRPRARHAPAARSPRRSKTPSTLGLRETDTNRVVRIWVAPDFVVRTKAGTYVQASTLRVKDTVIVQAYRDGRGNLIAQTIRMRNR